MGYTAEVKKVMIASPSDVAKERRIIRDVIGEWNTIHAEDRHIVLMPVGWESDSSPEMGERAQAIINRQLLKETDLLVAVFWTRLGTPTGTSSSGTVEEINEHVASGKPAMLYFSRAPVLLDSVDHEQYSALKAFKNSCTQNGLIQEYGDLAEFREKFSRQLAQTVIRRLTPSGAAGGQIVWSGASDNGAIARPSWLPELSESARELLLDAAKDNNGMIMSLGTMGGRIIQTNGRGFVEPGNPRSEARWKGAIDELDERGLIEDRGYKREAFFVTERGYRAADYLGEQ